MHLVTDIQYCSTLQLMHIMTYIQCCSTSMKAVIQSCFVSTE